MKWEYKVAYVEGFRRVSVEGEEHFPEEHERHTGFGRRFLNSMGSEGWELVDVQVTMPNAGYYVFKRPLADGAEPDMSVVKRAAGDTPAGGTPAGDGATAEATSL